MATINGNFLLFNESTGKYDQYNFSSLAKLIFMESGATAEEAVKALQDTIDDISLNWSSIEDKPDSAVSEIDNAVLKSHEHSNSSVINKFSENAGALKYNGKNITLGDIVVISATQPVGQPNGGIWVQPL